MSEMFAFQNAFHAAALSVSNRRRLGTIAVGNSPWITVNAPPGRNVLAVMLQADVVLVSTAAEAATASTDVLFEWIDQVKVAPTEGTNPRTETATTFGTEELERVCFDTAQGWSSGDIAAQSNHIGSYARAAATNFASPVTRTDTSELWVPVGGPGGAIMFHVPAITGVFAANVTVTTYTVAWFEVYSPYSGVVAAIEKITPTLATGNQDFQQYVPQNMAVDFMSFVGTNATTTNIGELYMTDNTGAQVINMDSGPTSAEAITATQYIYPRFATNAPTYSALCFSLNKTYPVTLRVKVLVSKAFNILFIAITGPNIAAPNKASPTPAPAATSQVGPGNPAIGPTPMKAA